MYTRFLSTILLLLMPGMFLVCRCASLTESMVSKMVIRPHSSLSVLAALGVSLVSVAVVLLLLLRSRRIQHLYARWRLLSLHPIRSRLP